MSAVCGSQGAAAAPSRAAARGSTIRPPRPPGKGRGAAPRDGHKSGGHSSGKPLGPGFGAPESIPPARSPPAPSSDLLRLQGASPVWAASSPCPGTGTRPRTSQAPRALFIAMSASQGTGLPAAHARCDGLPTSRARKATPFSDPSPMVVLSSSRPTAIRGSDNHSGGGTEAVCLKNRAE